MKREDIRARIDLLECLCDVQGAIGDVESVEWEDGDRRTLHLTVTAPTNLSGCESPVAFAHNLPPAVVLAGLRAMERELMQMADVKEAV